MVSAFRQSNPLWRMCEEVVWWIPPFHNFFTSKRNSSALSLCTRRTGPFIFLSSLWTKIKTHSITLSLSSKLLSARNDAVRWPWSEHIGGLPLFSNAWRRRDPLVSLVSSRIDYSPISRDCAARCIDAYKESLFVETWLLPHAIFRVVDHLRDNWGIRMANSFVWKFFCRYFFAGVFFSCPHSLSGWPLDVSFRLVWWQAHKYHHTSCMSLHLAFCCSHHDQSAYRLPYQW